MTIILTYMQSFKLISVVVPEILHFFCLKSLLEYFDWKKRQLVSYQFKLSHIMLIFLAKKSQS